MVDHHPFPEKLKQLNVQNWPIWEKEILEFPWYYKEKETCHILEGQVIVTPDNGKPVE